MKLILLLATLLLSCYSFALTSHYCADYSKSDFDLQRLYINVFEDGLIISKYEMTMVVDAFNPGVSYSKGTFKFNNAKVMAQVEGEPREQIINGSLTFSKKSYNLNADLTLSYKYGDEDITLPAKADMSCLIETYKN